MMFRLKTFISLRLFMKVKSNKVCKNKMPDDAILN